MDDLVAILILVLTVPVLRWLAPADRLLRTLLWGLWGAGVVGGVVARAAWGGFAGCVAAALAFAVVLGLALVHCLVARREWPARAMGIALCALTVVGGFQRIARFDQLKDEPLLPDVAYYRTQAQRVSSPFAAGNKAPLWPAVTAPLIRLFPDETWPIRAASCCAGIAVIPLMALVLGRFLGNPVGVLVAGVCALDTWMIDLCGQGLREEANLCLWLLFAAAVFGRDGPAGRGWLWAGLLGGGLLLLRNTNVAALFAVIIYAAAVGAWRWRRSGAGAWRPWQCAAAILMPLILVTPFYVNQWRKTGDAFHLEHRDARFYVNREFGGSRIPARPVTMPPPEVLEHDPYAGDPVSAFDYVFRLRPPREAVYNQFRGTVVSMLGCGFGWWPPEWFGILCAVGTLGLLVLPMRWMTILVTASMAGMPAHLISIGMLERRMLLQAYPFWLAGGVALLWAALARGLEAWRTKEPAPRA